MTPGGAPAAKLTWDGVLAWRMQRQLLDPVGAIGVLDTVARLCGVQAQVASSAELAIALRQRDPNPGEVAGALAERTLMRTWAMRGTLHLLAPADAGAYLALVAACRSWERPAWERNFGVSAAEVAALAEIVDEVLDGRILDRDELIDEVAARTGSRSLDEQLRSGWGAVLKPLAWTGHLCNGPSQGNRVTFTSPSTWLPGWRGLPGPPEAARIVIPAYLRAYGPATVRAFDGWLTRNSSRRADIREWFEAVEDLLVAVEVEGELLYAPADHVDELRSARPSTSVRLLAGFDQYLLGPGTGDVQILAAARRKLVSKTAGWIAPVVIVGGRAAGVWRLDDDVVSLSFFEERGRPAADALDAEIGRLGRCIGRSVRMVDKPKILR